MGASITGVGVTISFELLLADSLKMNFSKHFSGIKSQHDISTKDLVIFNMIGGGGGGQVLGVAGGQIISLTTGHSDHRCSSLLKDPGP